jgi:hypothetical protein
LYLYLGNVALVIIKKITPNIILKLNKKLYGNQPPKNKIDKSILIKSILAYSPRKKKAKVIAEYSILYPETNSASASGKSKR